MRRDFIKAVQLRTARCAIGASTLRRQGAPGAVHAARRFLGNLPLKPFGVSRQRTFRSRLDRATVDLQAAMPKGAQAWGTARKALNIFLRDALYTTYLRERYALARAEELLEIPLDAITADRLHAECTTVLPRWPGVRHLTERVSDLYQAEARRVAAGRGIAPVHLDTYWWGGDRRDAV
jgi:hypothetical protein